MVWLSYETGKGIGTLRLASFNPSHGHRGCTQSTGCWCRFTQITAVTWTMNSLNPLASRPHNSTSSSVWPLFSRASWIRVHRPNWLVHVLIDDNDVDIDKVLCQCHCKETEWTARLTIVKPSFRRHFWTFTNKTNRSGARQYFGYRKTRRSQANDFGGEKFINAHCIRRNWVHSRRRYLRTF